MPFHLERLSMNVPNPWVAKNQKHARIVDPNCETLELELQFTSYLNRN